MGSEKPKGTVVAIADHRSGAGKAELPAPPPDPQVDAAKRQRENEIVSQRIGNALGGMNQFVDQIQRGCEPNWTLGRQAIFGMALMHDRNVREFDARLTWLERSWFWRLLHRKQRPRFKREVVGK